MNNISMSARMPEGSRGKRFQTQHALGGISYSGIMVMMMNKNKEGSNSLPGYAKLEGPVPRLSGAEKLVFLNWVMFMLP